MANQVIAQQVENDGQLANEDQVEQIIVLSEQSFDSNDLMELQVNKVHWSEIEVMNRNG